MMIATLPTLFSNHVLSSAFNCNFRKTINFKKFCFLILLIDVYFLL
jgi:hypothetical protein